MGFDDMQSDLHGSPATHRPRASFTVTMLDDPDLVALKQRGASGDRAVAIFFMLSLLAKKLKNNGRFSQPLPAIAPMIYASPKDIEAACDLIGEVCKSNRTQPWLVRERGGGLLIRSFLKWNIERRGGPRENAGRPPKPKPTIQAKVLKSNRNQIDFKDESKHVASVSVSGIEIQQQQEPAAKTLPGAAAAGAGADEENRRSLLAEVGIGEPVLTELASEASLTPPVLRQEITSARNSGKHNGAIVLNLRARARAEEQKTQRRQQASIRQAATAEQERQQRDATAAAGRAAEARYAALTPEELAAHHEAIYAAMPDKSKAMLKPESKVMRATVIARLMLEQTGDSAHAS